MRDMGEFTNIAAVSSVVGLQSQINEPLLDQAGDNGYNNDFVKSVFWPYDNASMKEDIAEVSLIEQLWLLLLNIWSYHKHIGFMRAVQSILYSLLFVLDVATDLMYLTSKGLDQVSYNETTYNFRAYLLASAIVPLIIESL